MQLLCVSIKHQQANLIQRQTYALNHEQLALLENHYANNHLICIWGLITCNRCEIYLALHSQTSNLAHQTIDNSVSTSNEHNEAQTHQIKASIDDLLNQWSNLIQKPIEALKKFITIYINQETVEHLFKVASGLNSMVLGETQITHQIKQQLANRQAKATNLSILNPLLQKALNCAKYIRSHTQISQANVSMASVAAQLCKHIFQNIESQSILMIGAGMMMQEMAPYFLQRSQSIGYSNSIFLLNRSTEGIKRFINQFKNQPSYQTNTWQTSDLNAIQTQLNQADIIITCTNSLEPLITKNMLKQALKHRKHKSVVCIDLSVPRNIEVGCESLDSVYLYTVDDLGQLANAGQAHRQEATKHALELLNHKVQECMQWLHQQNKNTIKKAIIAHFEILKHNQTAEQIKQLNKSMHLWLMHASQISPEQQKNLLMLLEKLQ